jgi:hypothetical protein
MARLIHALTLAVTVGACCSPAWASSDPGAYRLHWPVPGEELVYRSCGCADSCWSAEARVRRTGAVKARLRCDCEALHFAQPLDKKEEAVLGSCAAINDGGQKFEAIAHQMALLRGIVLPWPSTKSEIMRRAESCLHLAGEVNGDQSDRDQEVNREMMHLDCGRTVKALNALRTRLPRGSVIRGRVDELLRSFR